MSISRQSTNSSATSAHDVPASDAVTTSPLTRREAREIERRTGSRPVAGNGGRIVDTGRIDRNEISALVSVLPTALVDRIATTVERGESGLAGAEGPTDAFGNRALTVRAARPAPLVAQRRRRLAGGFAVAASATALASAGIVGVGAQADVSAAHQANLVTAADTADTSESAPTEVDENAAGAVDVPAAPVVVDETNSSVVALGADVVQGSAAEAPAPVVPASSSPSSTKAPGSSAASSAAAAGPLQERILAAAKAQIGISGMDCTDMVQNALAAVGLTTSRENGGYDYGPMGFAAFGTEVPMSEVQPGDIIIAVSGGPHVAIYAGNGKAVHGGWNGAADDTVIDGLGHYTYIAIRVAG